ncbi:MAG TPA: MATE family efflux transporter, partial [Polyangiales bacterium]|nr:MATE family efflux transporter [Polyangiales bacterium]
MSRSARNGALAWHARPAHELLRLAWPIALSMLSFSLMQAVDTLFVGHIGAAALSGVSLGGMATFSLLCFGLGALRACKIAVAQAVGAGRQRADIAYLGAALWIALAVGIATALLGQGLALALPSIAATAQSGHYASVYASLRLAAAPIVLLAAALRETRQGAGDTRGPMRAALIANLVNALLVALFLHTFGWGVIGVAWATTIAQVVELALLAWLQSAQGFGVRGCRAADL